MIKVLDDSGPLGPNDWFIIRQPRSSDFTVATYSTRRHDGSLLSRVLPSRVKENERETSTDSY